MGSTLRVILLCGVVLVVESAAEIWMKAVVVIVACIAYLIDWNADKEGK